MSATVLEARAVITGEDRTGAMFAALERKIANLSKASKAIGEIPRYAASASRAIETASKASHAGMVAQISTTMQHGLRHALAQTALIAGPVGAAIAAAHKAVHASAEYTHEKVALLNAGRNAGEMQEIMEASRSALKHLPGASLAENLKVINETTGAFGSLHHAVENLPFMQKAASVLHAAAGDKIHEGAGELGNKMARFFEMRGTAGDTPVFQREASEMMRAMMFTRGNFNPGEMLNFAQQAKAALPLYSERFLTNIVPSLVTEFGGDRAGTAANAFRSVIMGKVNDKKQAEEWMRYGLLDPNQAMMKAGHAVGWRAGAVKGTNKALTDPLAWMMDDVLPAMAKKGVNVDDKLELSKAFGTMFRNVNANLMAEALGQYQSQQRLLKDEALKNKTATVDQAYERNQWTDPLEAWKSVKEAANNLGAASGVVEHGVAPALANLARGMQTVTRMMLGDHEAGGEPAFVKGAKRAWNYWKYGTFTEDGSPEGIYKKMVEDGEKAQAGIMASTLKVQGLRRAVAEAETSRNRADLVNLYAKLAGAEEELKALQATAGRAAALKTTLDAVRSAESRRPKNYILGAGGIAAAGGDGYTAGGHIPARSMDGGWTGTGGTAIYSRMPGAHWFSKAGYFEPIKGPIPTPPKRPADLRHVTTEDEYQEIMYGPKEGRGKGFQWPSLGSATASPYGSLPGIPTPSATANAAAQQPVSVSVTGQAALDVKVSVDAAPELKATAHAMQGMVIALRGALAGQSLGKSSPDAAPGANTGVGGQ